jgi:hypothetical protein
MRCSKKGTSSSYPYQGGGNRQTMNQGLTVKFGDLSSYPSVYDLKRLVFQGYSLKKISKKYTIKHTLMQLYVKHIGIASWQQFRDRYSSLRLLFVARTIKAATYDAIAEHLKVSRQAVQGNVNGHDLIERIKKIFRRNKKPASLADGWPRKAGIILIQSGKTNYLLYSENLKSYRIRTLNKYKSPRFKVSILMISDSKNIKRECFRFRFLHPEYKLMEELSGRFPGVSPHPANLWAARYDAYLIGYFQTRDNAIGAIRKYVLYGKCKVKRKGRPKGRKSRPRIPTNGSTHGSQLV